MRPLNFPLSPVARACAATALCGALATFGPQAFAATAAGTQIKNLATVTYEDAAGNVYSAQSNEAVVTVAQVYFATIGSDVDVTAAPGQTVYLPYVLSNTGNGTDIFDVAATSDAIAAPVTLGASNVTVYRDTNGNGQPDSGEPELTSLSLIAGESTDIVVAVQVPTTATAADTLGVTLTATAQEGTGSPVASSVVDLSPLGGRDTTDGTVQSLIAVTNDAVLAMTKTSSHDAVAKTITYTVTVTNNGNTAATDVALFDGLPAGTAYVSSSVSGLLTTNGDTLATLSAPTGLSEMPGFDFNADGDESDGTEAALGIDLNTDGDTADTDVVGVYAKDLELAPNATVSMTITVSYDPVSFGGGNTVDNVAYLSANVDGALGIDTLESSNRTSDKVAQSYSVTINDTGVGALPLTNDGGDDDGTTANDTQTVDSAASGGVVLFNAIISNTGNGDDSFELSVDPGTFPTGTVFTFYDESGAVQLTDTNGVGGVDSGLLPGTNDPIVANRSRTIQVRAKLPQGAPDPTNNGGAGYLATVTTTSAVDPSATAASETVSLQLDAIVAASADIHAAATGTAGADEDPLGAAPYVPVNTIVGDAGATVNIPVFIDNESGVSDSFQLLAGSSVDGAGALGALPAGWSVQFFLDAGYAGGGAANGIPTGPAITSTPTIPGGLLDYALVAVVSIPADAALAQADVLWDANGDATATSMDLNGDGDGDYPLFLRILSASSGATDTFLDAIDVNAGRAVAFTPSSSNQVEPGGTVDFPLTFSNTGNSEETLELTAANSQPGFNNTVAIDTDGNGTPDTVLGNLAIGPISVQLADGSVVVIQVVDTDADGIMELVLPPGVEIPLLATTFAPATAPAGQVDTMTLLATNMDGGPDATVSFQSDVINGQVRLTKTVAVDRNCDGDNLDLNADPTLSDSTFQTVQTFEVEPQECAIWRVIAENQGDVDARNVTITDAVTAFSTFEGGSLAYCMTNNCAPATVSDGAADDQGAVNGSAIVFYVGTGPGPIAGTGGGTLVPGEKATAQFSVRVD